MQKVLSDKRRNPGDADGGGQKLLFGELTY